MISQAQKSCSTSDKGCSQLSVCQARWCREAADKSDGEVQTGQCLWGGGCLAAQRPVCGPKLMTPLPRPPRAAQSRCLFSCVGKCAWCNRVRPNGSHSFCNVRIFKHISGFCYCLNSWKYSMCCYCCTFHCFNRRLGLIVLVFVCWASFVLNSLK